jgi:hypothetical protein
VEIKVTVEDVESVDLATTIETRQRYNADGEREDYDLTLGHVVAEKVFAALKRDDNWGGVHRKFLEIRDEEIRKAVQPIVVDALAGPIQKTNSYGEATGATTTMRELIIGEVGRALTEKADRFNRDGPTLLGKEVTNTVRAMLDAELKAVFDAEKAKIVAAVKNKAADLIADAVAQGVGR